MQLKDHLPKIKNPVFQVISVGALSLILTLIDSLFPHDDTLFEVNAGPWIVTTAMILFFIIVNTVVALRIVDIIPYWLRSLVCFVLLYGFSYGLSYLLSGKHIDDVGSFRWLWMVLGMVYLVFFIIVRSMKKIMDFAINQDKKLRGED